jgi:hypothetical protein
LKIAPTRRWILHFHDGMTTAPECADRRVVANGELAELGPVVLSLVSSGGGKQGNSTKGGENYKTATATLEFNAADEFEFFDRNQIPRAAA